MLALLGAFSGGRDRRLALITGFQLTSFILMLVFYQLYFPDVHGLRYVTLTGLLLCVLIGGLLQQVFFCSEQTGLRQLTFNLILPTRRLLIRPESSIQNGSMPVARTEYGPTFAIEESNMICPKGKVIL